MWILNGDIGNFASTAMYRGSKHEVIHKILAYIDKAELAEEPSKRDPHNIPPQTTELLRRESRALLRSDFSASILAASIPYSKPWRLPRELQFQSAGSLSPMEFSMPN